MAGGTNMIGRNTNFENKYGVEAFFRTGHAEAMLKGLNALRCADKLLDVALIVEGQTFKAHRVVLAACSDYFLAMFTDAIFSEASQSEIKLNGVSARGIELILEYAYTSQLKLDHNNVQDVLSVATHVQMKSVISECSCFLNSQIDLGNCVPIAALADLYSLESLKQKTYRYICSRFDEFARTPDLFNLSWDQLENILSSNHPVDCSEERVLQITLQYCKERQINAKIAKLLLTKVQFQQISNCAMHAIIRQNDEEGENEILEVVADRDANASDDDDDDNDNDNDNDNDDDVIANDGKNPVAEETETVVTKRTIKIDYSELAAQEMLRQEQQMEALKVTNVNGTSCEEIVPTDVLLNSRGMELALVKIGGFETNGLTNQISCYLPSKGKWELLTVIPHIEQCNYGTAVLGNELFIVGGSYDVCLKEYIHPFGFRYSPTKNEWSTIAPIQADRCRFSLNAVGNFLYAVGGVCDFNDSADPLGINDLEFNCERFDVIANTWEYLPPLAENRSQHAGVVLDDKLYISGGIDRHIVLPTLWCFNTTTQKWTKLSSMPTPRADHVLIVLDGRIYACGGWYEDPGTEMRVLAETIDYYDPSTDQWFTECHNPMPKYYTGVAAVKRKIYFIGGLHSNATFNRATSAVQCYDLDTNSWSYNSEWEYPSEVWECSCASFFVPRERNDFSCYWAEN